MPRLAGIASPMALTFERACKGTLKGLVAAPRRERFTLFLPKGGFLCLGPGAIQIFGVGFFVFSIVFRGALH